MDRIGPNSIARERESLLAEIREAFKGVTREGGVSWSEADALDGPSTEAQCAAARASDTETSWEQLIDEPAWLATAPPSEFSFLDAIGFRYYLAPAMIRCVRSGEDEGICFHLTLGPQKNGLREHCLYHWSLLTDAQRACVKRFLLHMQSRAEADDNTVEAEYWRRAYESHWATP